MVIACNGQGPTSIEIAPGVMMPYVNLGGVASEPSNYTDFIMSGGVGLDTALTYTDAIQNQVAETVKLAIQNGKKREDIFITTKIPCCHDAPGLAKHMCASPESNVSAADAIDIDIGILGAVDLILLHWPCTTLEGNVATYKALENALAAGKTRAIGVSNFNASMLQALIPLINVKPAVNQCSHAVGSHNATHEPELGGDDMTATFCKANGISYSAYSPLGGLSGIDIFNNPTVIQIGKGHNVSSAQVALRWLVQQNISIVTAADKHEYIVEDMDLFSFQLTKTEMSQLADIK